MKAYYSTVFKHPATAVWSVVRDFNAYPIWVDSAGESAIEDGKSGDTIGAVRHVVYQGRHIRQRLLAQSDIERTQVYGFAEDSEAPVANYRATIRVTPVVDGDRAFVEWWAIFDCDVAQGDARAAFLRDSFAGWLESLRRSLTKRPA